MPLKKFLKVQEIQAPKFLIMFHKNISPLKLYKTTLSLSYKEKKILLANITKISRIKPTNYFSASSSGGLLVCSSM